MPTEEEHSELFDQVKEVFLDAEFKVLTESNEESAMTSSGLAILFNNWTNQH